jgi:hypothetical protein
MAMTQSMTWASGKVEPAFSTFDGRPSRSTSKRRTTWPSSLRFAAERTGEADERDIGGIE